MLAFLKLGGKTLWVLLLFSHSAWADDMIYNHGFSYFGLGFETISYGESTVVAGESLNMNKAVGNVMQRSGGYTVINETDGFYIQAETTLDPLSSTESWNLGSYGTVQTNARKVRWNDLNLLYAQLLGDSGFHWVGGSSLTSLTFNRSNFEKGSGAPAFEAAIAPSTFVVFPGAISEDSMSVSAIAGMRYDSRFAGDTSGNTLTAGITAGVPVYYKVENSNFPNTRWQEYFHGYDVQANVGYSFRIYKDFLISTYVNYSYKQRPETSRRAVNATQSGRIPEVKAWKTVLAIGLNWGF